MCRRRHGKSVHCDAWRSEGRHEVKGLHADRAAGDYRYNHSLYGWTYNENWRNMPPKDHGPDPLILGINRLYGSGAVLWRPKDDFEHLDVMCNPGAYPGGAVSHGDTFYY